MVFFFFFFGSVFVFVFNEESLEVGYRPLTGQTLGGQNAKFQTIDRQLKFRPNHRCVSCNLPLNKSLLVSSHQKQLPE